ncbi:AAA family ATPase [Endozoicomonas sp. 8E]|uniref:AAA family ATPase n=1 Tax=Endozoicomonas sp. 8E TaxID=3035692 RepID=UPI0029392115|nr:AAA family ATPase [Endozoicomonas sp. 8E]WOG28849.1 AAA family ATPase [Endozoicomonas sp. 8E]
MDGRIREINKSVLDSGASDNIVPAKKPKLVLPANDVEICSDVITKLNISSPRIKSPDPVRTVSSTKSSLPKAPNAFDFRFVASDDEVRQLLVARTGDKHRDVTLISHPDDLSQANLMSRLSISEEGRQALYPGKLFEGSQPLTLVLDIRKLTSDELPKFNDLLDPDNPCLYDRVSQKKRPLGEHVSLLVLADPAQLAMVGSDHEAPGTDFWRRINRPGNTWQFAQTGNDPSMKINEVPPLLPEFPCPESTINDNTIVINCHLHSHWRQLLLGGPGIDKKGRIQHIPGRLELLKAGQRVILKGANWGDLTFEQTMRQILAQQCFESNGKTCELPDDIQFYQMPVGKDELRLLFQSLTNSNKNRAFTARLPITINQGNIREWLSPMAISPEGYAAANTCLLEQVRAGGAVIVTSPLTQAHWFCLLDSLQTIHQTTGLKPRLQVADSGPQPKALGLPENDEQPLSGSPLLQKKVRDNAALNTLTYQQHAQASYWINHHPQAPLVIQVNEQTGFSQLFDNIHITSEQKAHFGHRRSALQEALTAGKLVVFRGLETNPRLQQLLEPLMVGQPLLVNGQLQAYPQADIKILWPESAKSASSILHSMVIRGKPCPEIDIWVINTLRHKISRTELPEQALNELYKAFKTIPDGLCNPLPERTEGLLNNLILAARRAQQVDHSQRLLPCHWRKAINSVITHGARQNTPVRDFMKVACWHLLPDKTPDENQTISVDPDRLTAIINSAPRLDREFVIQNLWQLARAFDPAVFRDTEFEGLRLSYESPLSLEGGVEILDRLCAIIVAQAPEEQQNAMAYQLQVDPAAELCESLAIRPSRQIKRLQDALASGWQLPLPLGQTRSDAIQALASDCFHRARAANSAAAGIERIEHRLAESLRWTGSTNKPLSALARDLYHGEISQKDRESRRLSRLHERFADSPVIFLQGETGTGKSYFSAKMARASGQASVISLGPSDSEQTLMKRWQWQQHIDGDRSMVQQNRALMEWARTESDKDEEYITLVLDEANLAKAGLLASLNGLWEPQPCIYVNGHPVKVSPKHRVILTGNPDHYAGRRIDPALKEKLPRAYYPRLDQAFLRDRVVEPALVNQLQRHLPETEINDIVHSATESIMALWQYYQELLPEHEFTPRDLTDICSWVGWYLDRALPTVDPVTCKQINSLIRQSFRDLLGPEIAETCQDALLALEIWFAARYQLDNTLSDKVRTLNLKDIQQPFMQFTERNRPEFDTSGSAVSELVQQLGQDLSRCQQAYHLGRKHGGRQATLIAGPAGRGKDATLNLMIESVRQQAKQRQESMPEVFYLNACDCSWDKVCEVIRKAKVDGGIVVISEMNLIDSQHLEGELNDILAGDAHSGFHLFATINPPEYSGRKPLSPALKGRFRHLPIRQYNPTELQTIAGKVLPDSSRGKFVAKKLTEKHCLLRAYLQQKNLPLQPTGLDLQNVARAVLRGADFSDNGLHQCFNQHYRLYLMAASISLEELPGSSAPAASRGTFDPELCHWFNRTVSDIGRPWLIRLGDYNSMDEQRHEILINADLTEDEIRTEIIRMMAQTRWQASGLSLKPDKSNDILTRALYRHCQQHWFKREFERTGVDANSVFPMPEEEQQTLKLPAFQPFLQEAEQRISAWNSNAIQLWPGFAHQIMGQPGHWLDHSEKDIPKVGKKQTSTLDQNTNYEDRQKPKVIDYKIFNSRHPSNMYRVWARDINVTAEGDVELIDMSDQDTQRVELLTPARLPEYGQEVKLTRYQTLATLNMRSKNGQYALPSLTPDDYIVALRSKPDLAFTLVRDPYTGLHTLTIPEANAKQSILCAYVVEPGKTSRETPATGERPEPSMPVDTRCSEGIKTVLDKVFASIEEHPTELKVSLKAIIKAKNTKQRIKAITNYCKQFSGAGQPASGKNFFEFLVTERQGSCRHRVPVFVAFCRYFGISSRQIESLIHIFAEYSEDGGQTWKSVDLGGAPVKRTEIKPDFQPNRKVSGSSTKSGKIRDHLKIADSTQQQALAEDCADSSEGTNEPPEAGSALSETLPDIFKTVRKLWEAKDLTGFSMGVAVLLETEELGYFEKQLVGDVYDAAGHPHKPMSEAVKQILSNSDKDQVIEPLKSLHSKMIIRGGASPQQWLSSMIDILKHSDLSKPSVIHFAREALYSGWLDPGPIGMDYCKEAHEHHELLLCLEGVDGLKVKAAHCLKKWYKAFLCGEENSQAWRSSYKSYQDSLSEKYDLSVGHYYGGFSPFLERKMANPSLQTAWTHVPEGTPDITRMLMHQPAYAQLIQGKENLRPVIIIGQPSWSKTAIVKKIQALLAENNPDLKPLLEKVNQYEAITRQIQHELDALDSSCPDRDSEMDSAEPCQDQRKEYEIKKHEIKGRYELILKSLELLSEEQTLLNNLTDKCQQKIHQAYTLYLYEMTCPKGGRLTYCWANAYLGDSVDPDYYGAHDPSSAKELFAMMCNIYGLLPFQNSLKDACLRQALNATDALVLKNDELTKIAKEFLNSMNLNSLYNSLDTR